VFLILLMHGANMNTTNILFLPAFFDKRFKFSHLSHACYMPLLTCILEVPALILDRDTSKHLYWWLYTVPHANAALGHVPQLYHRCFLRNAVYDSKTIDIS
jgi:hypothetical protein